MQNTTCDMRMRADLLLKERQGGTTAPPLVEFA